MPIASMRACHEGETPETLFSKLNQHLRDAVILQILFLIIQINNSQGDPTYVLASTKTLGKTRANMVTFWHKTSIGVNSNIRKAEISKDSTLDFVP